jgi:hypothetical protein
VQSINGGIFQGTTSAKEVVAKEFALAKKNIHFSNNRD